MKTSLRDGEIWIQERWGPVRLKGTSYVRLYVDPRDGILRRNMAWQKRRVGYGEQRAREDAERALRMRLVDRTTQLHRFGDCWWEVTLVDGHPRGVRLVPLGECGWTRIVEEDVVQRAGLSTLPLRELYGRANCYAVAKRQLSRKEMRDLGLARPH